MEGDSTVPLLFWPKTAGPSLQYVDTHYCGEERTSDFSTFLALHEQYAYTNGPKLEHKMWHSLFDLQVHVYGELHLCCQKTKSYCVYQNFLEGGVFGSHHSELWHFVSGSYAKDQLSSPVIIVFKKFGSLLIISIRW